jgi:hypothetical protein
VGAVEKTRYRPTFRWESFHERTMAVGKEFLIFGLLHTVVTVIAYVVAWFVWYVSFWATPTLHFFVVFRQVPSCLTDLFATLLHKLVQTI